MKHAIKSHQIEDKIKSIIVEIVPELATSQAQINSGTGLTKTLALDSLALAELFMAIEDTFKLRISEEEAQRIETIGALVDCIAHKIQA